MKDFSSLLSFYKTSYWIFTALAASILLFRVWRLLVTRRERFFIFRIKGFLLEKILKGGFALGLLLAIFSLPPLLLIESTPSTLVPFFQTYLLLFISLSICVLELVLCTTLSTSLMKRGSKKGLLSFIIILCLFIFSQFTGASIRVYDYPDNTSLILEKLPVKKGEWLVLDGGGSRHTNSNNMYKNTSYGASISLIKEGKFFIEPSTINQNFYAFGKNVLSPVNAILHHIVDTIPDTSPSFLPGRPVTQLGNHISLKINDSCYLVFSNLKHKSVVRKKNSTVTRGEKLGEIGNSSIGGWPFLRIHVQDKPTIDSTASGLPFRFKEIYRKRWLSKSKSKYDFLLRNDIVTP